MIRAQRLDTAPRPTVSSSGTGSRWAALGPFSLAALAAVVGTVATLLALSGDEPVPSSDGLSREQPHEEAVAAVAPAATAVYASVLDAPDPALSALITALSQRWQREPLPGQGPATDPTLLPDSLRQLQPWLARQPEAVWSRIPDLGPSALPVWTALLLVELNTDAARAWRHAVPLTQRHGAWSAALIEPLLAPMWQRREFEVLLRGLDAVTLAPAQRDAWKAETASRWTETAPAQAAAWAVHGGANTAELLTQIQDRWINQDARSATVFASTLPTGVGQALLSESLSRWLALDGAGAREWIRSQGANAALDAAIAAHATQDELARQQPMEAIDLVRRISDAARREEAQWALARTLRDIDAARTDLVNLALAGARPRPQAENNDRSNDQPLGDSAQPPP